MFSPRTRGCSLLEWDNPYDGCVFPAHAGLFRGHAGRTRAGASFPRARGVVPDQGSEKRLRPRFSPRTRGCSRKNPRTCARVLVFPAHAGLFPTTALPRRANRSFPRVRGVVPTTREYAAGRARFPRARGVGPTSVALAGMQALFSPRKRGCSRGCPRPGPHHSGHCPVFPAHAGFIAGTSTGTTAEFVGLHQSLYD